MSEFLSLFCQECAGGELGITKMKRLCSDGKKKKHFMLAVVDISWVSNIMAC